MFQVGQLRIHNGIKLNKYTKVYSLVTYLKELNKKKRKKNKIKELNKISMIFKK